MKRQTLIEIIRAEIDGVLSEELIGNLNGSYGVYKNPKSIDRLAVDLRSLSDKNGNFFVIDSAYSVTHDNLAMFLRKHEFISFSGSFFYKSVYSGKFITWERNGRTNDFYLAEGISETTLSNYKSGGKFSSLVNKVQNKNPHFRFIIESIMKTW